MANKVFKGIKMPGLNDFYVLPEAVAIEDENGFVEIKSYVSDTVEVENLDTTLTKSGMAADAAEVGKILNQKVDKVDGEAQCLTVEDGLTIKRGHQAEGAYFYPYVDDHNYPTVELLGTANDDFVKLYGIANPTDANDAVNKQYVDTNFAPVYANEYFITSLDETDAILTSIVNDLDTYGSRFIMFNYDGQLFGCTVYRGSGDYSWAHADSYTITHNYKMHRILYGGVWQPWEYENPPMMVGEIYRTTERFKGYPVYAVNIACGMAVHGETQVTLSAGIVGDPEFEACHNEWTVVGYEGSMYDAFYNGQPAGNWTDKVGEYPLWSVFSSIKAMWSANGLTLNFSYKDNSFANTSEGDTYITVKFIKKETY